jgi:hypothetical protein
MAARYRLVFTHIGKTGGSSVAAFLDRIVSACDLNMLIVSGASSVLETADLSERTFEAEDLRLSDFQIITGHVPFATARKYFMPARFVTVLRDPRWQLISNYCSQHSNMEKPDFGMSDFIASVQAHPQAEWALDNLHTRMLSDRFNFGRPATQAMLRQAKANLLRNYLLIGDTDALETFFRSLGRLYGLKIDEPPRKNVTGAYRQHVTDGHLAFAAETNAIDMELLSWARAKNLFVAGQRRATITPRAATRPSELATTLMRRAITAIKIGGSWSIMMISG